MHPYAMEQIVRQKMAEDHATAARWRRARDLRASQSASTGGTTGESLLERLIEVLRNAARPSSRPTSGVA